MSFFSLEMCFIKLCLATNFVHWSLKMDWLEIIALVLFRHKPICLYYWVIKSLSKVWILATVTNCSIADNGENRKGTKYHDYSLCIYRLWVLNKLQCVTVLYSVSSRICWNFMTVIVWISIEERPRIFTRASKKPIRYEIPKHQFRNS